MTPGPTLDIAGMAGILGHIVLGKKTFCLFDPLNKFYF